MTPVRSKGVTTDLTLDKEDLRVLEEEKVIRTSRCLQEKEIFSLSSGMYGRNKVDSVRDFGQNVADPVGWIT